MTRARANGLRCPWINRQPPSHRKNLKVMLGLFVLCSSRAIIHASSFNANSIIKKNGLLSINNGGSTMPQKVKRGMVAITPDALLDRGFDRGTTSFFPRPEEREVDQRSATATLAPPLPELEELTDNNNMKEQTTENLKGVPLSNIDIGTFFVHFCAAVTITLPVMIVPMMDAELLASSAGSMAFTRGASLAATMATIAPMGNGIGKLVNGMVCQQLGGSKSSKLYFGGSFLATLALASVALFPAAGGNVFSRFLTTDYLGLMVASTEFCASIQWTVCSLFLSRYYKNSPALFARGVTILAMSSTGGQIAAKVGGGLLLNFLHWRHIARLSVLTAVSGFCVSVWTSRNMAKAMEKEQAEEELLLATQPQQEVQKKAAPPAISAGQAAKRVLGSPVFWGISLAHVSGYLTRTGDRILGSFLQDITSLPPQVCGGLTAFMTVGFLYGLVTSSKKFHQQSTIDSKLDLLKTGYKRYFLSVLGLVASAAFGRAWHPYVSASVITLCGSIMASSIAFPFFQVPNMVSSVFFGEVKPVALSLIDGMGIILTAPLWKIFNRLLLPNMGWSVSWGAMAGMVTLCGALFMRVMPGVLELQEKQQQELAAQPRP